MAASTDLFHMIENIPALFESQEECSHCSDQIILTDELFCLEIVFTDMVEGQMIVYLAQSDDGDYLYSPLLYHLECWEETVGDLFVAVEELSIDPTQDDFAILECTCCNSGIRLREIYGQATFGELHCSKRQPEGVPTNTFVRMQHSQPDVYCISCLKLINDNISELWNGDISQEGECDQGTHLRCWRGMCPGSDCRLHMQGDE